MKIRLWKTTSDFGEFAVLDTYNHKLLKMIKYFANCPSPESRKITYIQMCRFTATELSLPSALFLELEVSRFEKYFTKRYLGLDRRDQAALPFGFFLTLRS